MVVYLDGGGMRMERNGEKAEKEESSRSGARSAGRIGSQRKPRSERAKKMDARAGWSKAARKPWPSGAMHAGHGLDAAKAESAD